jgi:hypothetical protein
MPSLHDSPLPPHATGQKKPRTALAFLLAPAVVPALIALLALLPNLAGLGLIAAVMAAVTYGVTFVFGVPLYLLLRAWNLLTWWSLTLCGAILGLLPGLVFAFASQYHSLIGAITGLAFWCIAFAKTSPRARSAA